MGRSVTSRKKMTSKSLMGKYCPREIFLQTHDNSRVILPSSLINIQQLVENNNIEDGDVCIVASPAVKKGGDIKYSSPLVVTTAKMLLTQGEKISYIQIEAEDSNTVGTSQEVSNDEELTSLTWLQSVDLLQNMKFLSNSVDNPKEQKLTISGDLDSMKSETNFKDSPDRENESSWDGSDQSSPDLPNQICENHRPTAARHRAARQPESKLTKPPHSFSTLIFLAIESSSSKALPVRDIYSWIIKHFPYYRYAPLGWKNSVRHNLSLNRCFCKYENGPNVGKGSLWMVDPIHRSQLIQSLCKAPYMKADFLHHIINGKAAEETKNTESNIRVQNSRNPSVTTPNRSNIPDPKLFPYLSRHLATNSDFRDSPDVDAATAMLALGQTLNLPSNDTMTKNQQWIQPVKKDYSLKKNRPNSGPISSEEHNIVKGEEMNASSSLLTIDDHTYSFSPRPARSKNQTTIQISTASRKLVFCAASNKVVNNQPEAASELKNTTNKEITKRCRSRKGKRKEPREERTSGKRKSR